MTSRGDEVQESMYSVVSEAWVTLNSGLFRQNVVVLTFKVADNLLKPRQISRREKRYRRTRHVRKLIIDIVAKPRGIDNGKSNTYAILLEFYRFWFNREGYEKASRIYLPTLTGLIRIPSSICAPSGLSETLWANTSDSQRVLTKVVRPVPEAPRNEHWGQWRDAKGMGAHIETYRRPSRWIGHLSWPCSLCVFLQTTFLGLRELKLLNRFKFEENLLSTSWNLKVRGGVTSFMPVTWHSDLKYFKLTAANHHSAIWSWRVSVHLWFWKDLNAFLVALGLLLLSQTRVQQILRLPRTQ